MFDLQNSQKTISEIASEYGFGSGGNFVKHFKANYGTSPGRYRKQNGNSFAISGQRFDESLSLQEEFHSLLIHLPPSQEIPVRNVIQKRALLIDTKKPRISCNKKNWKNLVCVGYARDLLSASVQNLLMKVQSEIRFSYVRINGIFDDDMFVYGEDSEKNPVFDFSLIDRCLDFILENGLKPYLDLGFVPSLLADRNESGFHLYRRGSNLCMPNEIEKWIKLEEAFFDHIENQYGIKDTTSWYFSIMSIHFAIPSDSSEEKRNGLERYFLFCKKQYEMIRKRNRSYKITAPSLCSFTLNEKYFADFLLLCRDQDCLPDQLTFQCYPYRSSVNTNLPLELMNHHNQSEYFDFDEDYILHFRENLNSLLDHLKIQQKEITVSEWNSTMSQHDYSNDSCFKSCYLIKNILENYDAFWGMGYWTMNEIEGETIPEGNPFFGGYGLHTANGIAKSGYYALRILNRLGENILDHGNNFFITRSKDGIQIILYNYCHFDRAQKTDQEPEVNPEKCYNRFVEKGTIRFSLEFSRCSPGTHRIRQWRINREHGSSFDSWLRMGQPDHLKRDELEILENLSGPMYRIENVETGTDGKIRFSISVAPHEVLLIVLEENCR